MSKYNLQALGYSRLNMNELKEILRSHDLKVGGKRADLVKRLEENNIPPPSGYRREILDISSEQIDLKLLVSEVPVYTGNKIRFGFVPQLIDETTALLLYHYIYKEMKIPDVVWRRHSICLGDSDYVYNDKSSVSWETIPLIKQLKQMLEKIMDTTFTYCVIQYYPCGKSSIKPHRDRELNPGSIIAGLSLGTTRTLRMGYFEDGFDLPLPPGSLYVFYPPTNDHWSHAILEDTSIEDARISLTFRYLHV